MAALRSLEAESVFCEQMVEHAEAASFRNRWDRDRLRFWQQRLRAARAAIPAKVSAEVEKRGVDGTGRDSGHGVARLRPSGGSNPPSTSRPTSPAPLAALPDPPAPTLFDKEAA